MSCEKLGVTVSATAIRSLLQRHGLSPAPRREGPSWKEFLACQTTGYLHACQPGRQALVYDLMEPYRPQVDREVLAFIRSQVFTPKDFVIDARGVCRLNPEMARCVTARTAASVAVTSVVIRLGAERS